MGGSQEVTEPATGSSLRGWSPVGSVVDADVHHVVPSIDALLPYLSGHWREYITQSAFKGPVDTAYPPGAPTSVRPDLRGADGGPAGSRLDALRRDVLDPWNAEVAILSCPYGVDSVHNPDSAAAVASAVNDWQISEWLEPEPRLRGSLLVTPQQPALAAREIDRLGDHPGIVQVVLPVCSAAPYGNRAYWPIYEAATRHDLVVALHFGGAPGVPPTGAGWPSYYLEEYAGMAVNFQTQILSLIVEGVFDRFPPLRMVCAEGGFTWLPALLWRLDKEWKGLRREVPWTRRVPSAYVHEHMRFTIQPLDAPPRPEQMRQVIEQIGSDELLLFATDYPHWHFDRPEDALPPGLPDTAQRAILRDNAREFFRLR